jgi:hypothetical protein
MVKAPIILPFESFAGEGQATILVPLGFEADCEESSSIGDLVILSLTTDFVVETLTNNNYDSRLCVGIIREKSSPTSCQVIVIGLVENLVSGLQRGKAVWVGTDGKATTTPPTTGHLQCVGMSISSTSFVVNIEPNKVILGA